MKKQRHKLKTLISSIILLASATSGQGAIIDHGAYFSDTRSGLDWLDVTASVNRSYNDVFGQLSPGGEFAGWRYATITEFNNLLVSWTGIPANAINRTITTGTTPSVDGLVILFGSTLDARWTSIFGQTWDRWQGVAEGEGFDFTLGILSDPLSKFADQQTVGSIWDNDFSGIDFYNANHRQVFNNAIHGDIGSFLVRTSTNMDNSQTGNTTKVDEPGILALLALGLGGIMAVRRTQRKASLPL